MTKDEALKLALDAILNFPDDISDEMFKAIASIKEALAQPEQEPVAWKPTDSDYQEWCARYNQHSPTSRDAFDDAASLYLTATPPKRKPLPPQSPCEMTQAEGKMFKLGWLECEAAHGIKE